MLVITVSSVVQNLSVHTRQTDGMTQHSLTLLRYLISLFMVVRTVMANSQDLLQNLCQNGNPWMIYMKHMKLRLSTSYLNQLRQITLLISLIKKEHHYHLCPHQLMTVSEEVKQLWKVELSTTSQDLRHLVTQIQVMLSIVSRNMYLKTKT